MKSLSSLVILVAAVGVAAAQSANGGLAKHPRAAVKTTDAPVTQEEARATFVRAETVLRRSLGMATGTPAVSIPAATKPVTRTQVVAEMTRIYNVLRPKIKLTPSPVSYDPAALRLADAKQKANLMSLIRMGAVAKIGPLATGPGDALSVPHFGDAVGFFMSRMAYMTHLPSSKWTGSLKKD